MTLKPRSSGCALAALFVMGHFMTAAAHAAVSVVTILPTNRGWASDTDNRTVGNTFYLAGSDNGHQYRDWFIFDLSSFAGSGEITSATLELLVEAGDGTMSPQGTETFELFDVSSGPADLDSEGHNPAVFADLGSGVSYGSAAVTSASLGTFVDITLNADGLAAVNAAKGGTFAIGGAVTTLDNPATSREYVFGYSSGPMNESQLSLTTVPESGSLALAGLGGALAFRRRRPLR